MYARRMDLYLTLADYIKPPTNGSLTLVCYKGYWNTACFVGVLRFFNAKNGGRLIYLVVENDSGSLSIPLNGEFVVYTIISRIPREFWFTLHTVIVVSLFTLIAKRLVKGRYRILSERNVLPLSLFLILLFNALLIGPSYVDQTVIMFKIPGVNVLSFFSINDSSVIINVDSTGIYRLVDAQCYLTNNYGRNLTKKVNEGISRINNNFKQPLETLLINDTSAKVLIPLNYYYELYNASKLWVRLILPTNISVKNYINIYCQLLLDKGSLKVKLPVSFDWKDLDIRFKNGVISVFNPNPVSIRVKYYVLEKVSNKVIYINETVVNRLSTVNISLTHLKGVGLIVFQYELLGLRRIVVLNVE